MVNARSALSASKETKVIDASDDLLYPHPEDMVDSAIAFFPDLEEFGFAGYMIKSAIQQNSSGQTVNFSVSIVISKDNEFFKFCRTNDKNIFRRDTYHSEIHDHQEFSSGKDSERTVVYRLQGGYNMQKSLKAVENALNSFRNIDFPLSRIERWENE
ncbi:hypothetical protein BSR29_01465 [Boudabousia liubingyangii]|uniref:Uncharacterized protein n=1 Tax=Boudabousia liubingyangii TaxID=1921764 RepID=A0A1Q5PQ62_9ACTO|nr:hypothetical protein [Boudabousia liubingyangii]OKL49652.1 hypothetical protein BSR29_01465 [Boudabousia liubingyangii]